MTRSWSRRAMFLMLFANGLYGCAQLDNPAELEGEDPDAIEPADRDKSFGQVDDLSRELSTQGPLNVLAASFPADRSSEGGQAAASTLAQHAPGFYQPSGCLTTQLPKPGTIILKFRDCTGPWQQVFINGDVSIRYEAKDAQGFVAFEQTNLTPITLNRFTITKLETRGRFASIQGVHHLEIDETSYEIVGPRGNGSSVTGSQVTTYEPSTQCLSIDGDWETRSITFPAIRWTTEVSGFSVCRNECPSGEAALIGAKGGELRVIFDGSKTAVWSAKSAPSAPRPGQISGEFTMACVE